VAARLAGNLSPEVKIGGSGRRYEQLDVGELAAQVDAWLIAWPPGTGLPMHDHAGSSAAVYVLRSELVERYIDEDRIVERRLIAGDRVLLPPDHLHEVVNAGGNEALSLHVYSPKLTTLRFRSEFAPWRPAPPISLAAEVTSTS
jgi:quercetin dioxygenase-like cupin family protein